MPNSWFPRQIVLAARPRLASLRLETAMFRRLLGWQAACPCRPEVPAGGTAYAPDQSACRPDARGVRAHRAPVSTDAGHGPVVAGQILVKFRPGAQRRRESRCASSGGGRVVNEIARTGVQLVAVQAGDETGAINRYRRNPNVLYAERNFIRRVPTPANHAARHRGRPWRSFLQGTVGAPQHRPGVLLLSVDRRSGFVLLRRDATTLISMRRKPGRSRPACRSPSR